ncbi:MAG: PfkB family carbohydrate kinase [Nanoarchaeota archaeon]|nr:PfkB family carbohydrate kinase [Nanoarchaeota archaeon]
MLGIEKWRKEIPLMRVAILGDFYLDRNNVNMLIGRNSLEHEIVPIRFSTNEETEYAPGGAGNVAVNFKKLGVEVVPFGVIGIDHRSKQLVELLEHLGISTEGLIVDTGRITPSYEKFHLETDAKVQDYRLDTPIKREPSPSSQQRLLEKLADNYTIGRINAVYIADQTPTSNYPCITLGLRKGIRESLISEKERRKGEDFHVMVDSRERIRDWANGKFILKPNQREIWREYRNEEEIITNSIFKAESMRYIFEQEVKKLYSDTPMFVTLHDKGAALFQKGFQSEYIPTLSVKDGDPTGCGDAFGTAALTALSVGESFNQAGRFGNSAAYHTIQQMGMCGMPNLEELFKNYQHIYGSWAK